MATIDCARRHSEQQPRASRPPSYDQLPCTFSKRAALTVTFESEPNEIRMAPLILIRNSARIRRVEHCRGGEKPLRYLPRIDTL